MNLSEFGLIESARKLNEIEKEFIKLSYESPPPSNKGELGDFAKRLWMLGSEAFDIRNDIYSAFSESVNIKIFDPNVRETLNKVRKNEKFFSISFFEVYSKEIEDRSGHKFDFPVDFDQFIESKYDEWHDDFYQRFHLTSYYKQIIAIGPIFSTVAIPDEAIVYFNEIREAVALDLEHSAIALSRSVMEMCLFEKLHRKGYFKQKKVINLDAEREDKLYHLIRIARRERLLDDKTRELADEIRIIANKILHPKKANLPNISEKKSVIFIIGSVIKVIEKLYS